MLSCSFNYIVNTLLGRYGEAKEGQPRVEEVPGATG
jgi:hypothetical protein